jgi:endonuclease YncB( thermonuclease family)
MSYSLVKGSFHLFYVGKRRVGSRPDGDSLWFRPDNPRLLANVAGRGTKFNPGGCVQLRFEAIDAPELHYEAGNQLMKPSKDARDFLLKEAGFQSITFSGKNSLTVSTANPHPCQCYILTRSTDPHGRPVSFVFAGRTNQADGSQPWLDAQQCGKSLNAKLAQAGHVYPLFYTGLPTDLRASITKLCTAAQRAGRGVWQRDSTMAGARVARKDDLTRLLQWPKLFRRLWDYFRQGGGSLSGFDAWLRADPGHDDALWIVSRAEKGNIHDTIAVSSGRIAMKYRPEDLVIEPK